MFEFLTQRFSAAFSRITGTSKLTEKNIGETLEKIRQSLLEADIAYEVVERFTAELHKEVIGKKVIASVSPSEMLIKIVYEKLLTFLGGSQSNAYVPIKPSSVVMVMGLQGSGKTTTIGKLAYKLKKQHQGTGKALNILTGSIDFYRPAALEQLALVAEKAGAIFYRSASTDPLVAARDLLNKFVRDTYDILLLDTAGRLHIDAPMLKELENIRAIVNPSHKILVLDSMTGQESLRVAQVFNERIGFDAAVLTKLDSDARGGAAFAFNYVLSKPIAYVGTGEKIEDLDTFHADRMASRILGMGDVETLYERIDEKIKAGEQEILKKNLLEGTFTLDDFAQQIDMVSRLGSLSSFMKYVPGMSSLAANQHMLEQGERDLKMFKAIINSMTYKERTQPSLLDTSRKKRIARGAGVSLEDINTLLIRFEQSKQFAKLLKKGGLNNFFK